MTILTKKFSEFATGNQNNTNQYVGLSAGANAIFSVPISWTTAERPTTPTNGQLGFNSDLDQYEYWDNDAGMWQQIPSDGDVSALIARLAAHTAGDGASMIGLENQGIVTDKTVQDMADAAFIVQTNNGSLANAQAIGDLASGLLVGTTTTGVVLSRQVAGTTNEIDITNPTGIGGNITISIADNPIIPGVEKIRIPSGTTAQRPTVPADGDIRYNTDINTFEWYDSNTTAWVQPSSGSIYLPLAGGTMSGNIDMDGNAIENLPSPVSGGDAVNKTYADTFLPLAGGTMSGSIDMDGNDVLNIDSASFQNGAFSQSFTSGVLAANLNYTLPTAYPAVTGYVLSATDAGVMSWVPNTTGTVNAGLINELAYYAAAGTTLSGLTTGNDGVLISSHTGVPSWLANPAATGRYLQSNNGAPCTWSSFVPAASGANSDITSMTGLTGVLQAPTAIASSAGLNNLAFTYTASSVNYLTSINAATGTNPNLTATGTDSNIGLDFQAKGTGSYRLLGTSASSAEIRLFEDTDNGSNYIGIKAPASIAANVTWTTPSVDSAGVMQSDGAGTLSLTRNPYLNTVVGSNTKTVITFEDNSASAVNYISVGNNITANAPAVQAKGTDANITLDLKGTGTGGAQVQGTGTNNNAGVGYVGEFTSSSVASGSAVSLTTGTPADITSISLTAGDWDVQGIVCFTGNAATTVTSLLGWISTTSATSPTPPNSGSFYTDQTSRSAGNTTFRVSVGRIRISIASTTTVYLSCNAAFAVNSYSAFGFIGARRVR